MQYRSASIQIEIASFLKHCQFSDEIIEAFTRVDNSHFLHPDAGYLSQVYKQANALRLLGPWTEETRFLCIGCDRGWFLSLVSALTNGKALVHGVDIDDEKVEYARSAGLPNSTILQASAYEIRVESSMKYDRILLDAGSDPSTHVLLRLLRVGGKLLGGFGPRDSTTFSFIILERTSLDTFNSSITGQMTFDKLIKTQEQHHMLQLHEAPWSVRTHTHYPESFRKGVAQVLLAGARKGLGSEIVTECIIPFMSRDWFVKNREESVAVEPRYIFEVPDLSKGRVMIDEESEPTSNNHHTLDIVFQDAVRSEANHFACH